MRVVIQRVRRAAVRVAGATVGSIDAGLLILLGVENNDGPEDVAWLCRKIVGLRIFGDAAGRMNESVLDAGGGLLVISQFTLFASTKRGNRPGFTRSAPPPVAIPLYERFVAELSAAAGRPVATGVFGADMQVELTNDGPVTIVMDSRNRE